MVAGFEHVSKVHPSWNDDSRTTSMFCFLATGPLARGIRGFAKCQMLWPNPGAVAHVSDDLRSAVGSLRIPTCSALPKGSWSEARLKEIQKTDILQDMYR